MLRKLLISLAVLSLVMVTFGTAFSNMGLHRPMLAKNTDGIPPDGTIWHELYPTYCTDYTQHRYFDNGDGVISICDYISLVGPDGRIYRHHIMDVLWTYVLQIPGATTYYFESYSAPDMDPPTTGGFHLVYPEDLFCQDWTMVEWIDSNGNQTIDYCDEVIMVDPSGYQYTMHVEDVSIDIVVDEGTAADDGTWGKIKSFFGGVF